MPGRPRAVALSVVLALLFVCAGCASSPYRYSAGVEGPDTLLLAPGEPQIERGRPVPILDGAGHYVVSLPSKLLLWNWKVDNHNVSPETEAKLRAYLADNGLRNVKIRINQYAPGGEWGRLKRNRAVHPAWRYTVGALTTAMYTAFPGRFFGGDNYNPFTNTVNIYSDHKGIALHEAGHAKDFAGREHKGTYAALRMLPVVPLVQEGVATGDAIGYDMDKRLADDEKNDYKILYPAYGTYVAGEALNWTPAGDLLNYGIQAVAAVTGHIVGRIKAAKVDKREPAAGGSR